MYDPVMLVESELRSEGAAGWKWLGYRRTSGRNDGVG